MPIILATAEIEPDDIGLAAESGVDLILMKQFFADVPEAIRAQLNAAAKAGIGIIGGFGFRRRSEDCIEPVEQFGEHPALVAWYFCPRWLPEDDDRAGEFIRKRSSKPIVYPVHMSPKADIPLDWASPQMLLGERGARSLAFLAQGKDRRDWRNWQPYLAAAVRSPGIVFTDFPYLPGRDIPLQELARPLMELIKSFVPVRDILAEPDVSRDVKHDGKLVVFLKQHAGVPYLLAVNVGDKPLKALLPFPGAEDRVQVWGAERILSVSNNELMDTVPRRTARLYVPVREETKALRERSAGSKQDGANRVAAALREQVSTFEKRAAAIKKSAAGFGRAGFILRKVARTESSFLGRKVEVPVSDELMTEVDGDFGDDKEGGGPEVLKERGLKPKVEDLVARIEKGLARNVAQAESDSLQQLLAEKLAELDRAALLWWDESFHAKPQGERILRPESSDLKSGAKGLVSEPVYLVNLSDSARDLLVHVVGRRDLELILEPVTGQGAMSQTAERCLAAAGFGTAQGIAAAPSELGECVVPGGSVRRLFLRAPKRLAEKSVSVGLRVEFLEHDEKPVTVRWKVQFGPDLSEESREVPDPPKLAATWSDPQSKLWQQSVWLNVSPYLTPRASSPMPRIELGLYQNEDENVSFMVTNTGDDLLGVAVLNRSDLEIELRSTFATPSHVLGGIEGWRQRFFYRTERVPVSVCGPLPLLGATAEIAVPPGQTREVFMTISSGAREPGTYEGSLAVVALNREAACEIPVKVTVWPIELPTRAPFPVYAWDYSGSDERTIRSLIRHKFNHFMMGTPTFAVRPDGNLEMDFTPVMGGFDLKKEHGKFVNSYGFVEAFDEQIDEIRRKLSEAKQSKKQLNELKELLDEAAGEGDEDGLDEDEDEDTEDAKPREADKKSLDYMSEEWQRIFTIFLTRWLERLQELGLGWDDFMFQTWDEAGLEPGEVEKVVQVGPLIRKIAPKLSLVMDPGGGMGALKAMAPYVDVWIPHCGGIWGHAFGYKGGVQRLEWFRKHTKANSRGQIWMYTTRTNFASIDPLNYFRIYFLKGWCMELDGVAKFSVSYFYGRGGRHPFKSYEAWREGAEDFQRLWMLRDALQKAGRAGVPEARLEPARTVLRRAAWECVGDDWFALDPKRKTRALDYWKQQIATETIRLRTLVPK